MILEVDKMSLFIKSFDEKNIFGRSKKYINNPYSIVRIYPEEIKLDKSLEIQLEKRNNKIRFIIRGMRTIHVIPSASNSIIIEVEE